MMSWQRKARWKVRQMKKNWKSHLERQQYAPKIRGTYVQRTWNSVWLWSLKCKENSRIRWSEKHRQVLHIIQGYLGYIQLTSKAKIVIWHNNSSLSFIYASNVSWRQASSGDMCTATQGSRMMETHHLIAVIASTSGFPGHLGRERCLDYFSL